jgi:hypothetical protein
MKNMYTFKTLPHILKLGELYLSLKEEVEEENEEVNISEKYVIHDFFYN